MYTKTISTVSCLLRAILVNACTVCLEKYT